MLLRLAFFGGQHVPQPQGVEQTGKQRTQYHNSDCPTGPPPSLLAVMDRFKGWHVLLGTPMTVIWLMVLLHSPAWAITLGQFLSQTRTLPLPVSTEVAPFTLYGWRDMLGVKRNRNNQKTQMATPEGITVREDRDQTPGAKCSWKSPCSPNWPLTRRNSPASFLLSV